MRIIAIAILLCLVACAQQNSDAEQNISSQPETPESKASQRKASSTGQEAALDESIRRILERNLPEVPEQEREKVYREEALTGHPTARGVQIMKEIALYSARHQPPSGYGPEYDRLKKEARVSYTNKAIEASITNAGIQDQKIFENEVERTAYIENLTRQREIEYQRSVGRALTNYEKDTLINYFVMLSQGDPVCITGNMSIKQFANIYIEEAEAEKISPYVALAQMVVDTGALRWGAGQVYQQNNFAKLGAGDSKEIIMTASDWY